MIKGSIVAIVTPMFEDGSLDRDSLRKLLDWHVAEGTDAICIVGTTGESATVTPEEHCELIKLTVDHVVPRAQEPRRTRGTNHDLKRRPTSGSEQRRILGGSAAASCPVSRSTPRCGSRQVADAVLCGSPPRVP